MNTIKRFCSIGLMLIFASSLYAQNEARTISWRQLQPVVEFDDPFEQLTPDQFIDLSILARVAELEKRDDAGLLTEHKRREAAEARQRLEEQKIDIEGLLSRREEITELHEIRLSSAEASLEGVPVALPGYMLPLQFADERVTEFLLVPWVGACIHTPPPPPNQMVYVVVPGGTLDPGRFAPIWIEGLIDPRPARHRLFLVDGSRDIDVAYAMVTNVIRPYSPGDSDLLAKVEVPDTLGSEHSKIQQWQMRTELLFTRAMTDIQHSRTSGPLLWGLLVAFLYGILHTLGPGHGKAVVVAYFVGERGSLWRGLRMGSQIALFHVLSAVLVVAVTDFAVRQATGHAPSDYRIIRLVSYGSIVVIGLWMLFKAVRIARGNGDRHAHHDEGCGCARLAEPTHGMAGLLSLAIGSVPCTGALLVLLFGMANDLLLPSIVLVVAISLGMALALAGVGIAAILGRRLLDHRIGGDESRRRRAATALRVCAAGSVSLVGCLLFAIAW